MEFKSILLVEDNLSDVDLAIRAFEKTGLMNPVFVVEDGKEALDYLFCTGQYFKRDQSDTPALILLDLKLPMVDGLSVLKQVRLNRLTKTVPVVILTSSNEETDIAAAYECYVNSYLRKPVDFTEFANIIQQLANYWLKLNILSPKPQ
ncbi:MAG: response regulator [Flavihumibacter sp.]|nr:response regulator [Flavihumibacter sp.]